MVSPPYVNPRMESGHSTYLRVKNQERSEKAAVPQASSTLNQGLIAHIAHKRSRREASFIVERTKAPRYSKRSSRSLLSSPPVILFF